MPPIVTCFSCIASSRAACVLGGVRLISSARITFAKIGPGRNLNMRWPDCLSSCNTSVPVMSDGIRSGVNWMRLKLRLSASDRARIINVFAKPGTPTSRQCPLAKTAIRSCSITSVCPTIDFASSLVMRR